MNKKVDTFYNTGTETMKRLSPPCLIPYNDLEIGKEIGEGTYGRVRVGKWKKNKYRVALKFCHSVQNMDDFLEEANIMTYFFF
jgi:serine/threonine protein kinase